MVIRRSQLAFLGPMTVARTVASALVLLLLIGGCASGPDPIYQGPDGAGRLVFDPEVGITRRGADPRQDEQALFALALSQFERGLWDECIQTTRSITQTFPEGSRAVDSLILRIRANLEAGRADDGPLPRSIALDRLMFLYLAPDYDERVQALLRGDQETRRYLVEFRAMRVQEFIDSIAPDAKRLAATRRLNAAQTDVNSLLTYYLPALQLREYRRAVAELGRDIAWLIYAAGNYSRAIQVSEDLLAVNPPPNVKGDTLFILGHAQRNNSAFALAASTFGYLYRGAGLRDTDTRWRPYALMWQIDQTIQTSKGYIYDLTPYEAALELLGEYELYRFENPNIPDAVKNGCRKLMEEVYEVMARRELNAARAYTRVGERRAAQYHRELASDWRVQLSRRLDMLAEEP